MASLKASLCKIQWYHLVYSTWVKRKAKTNKYACK